LDFLRFAAFRLPAFLYPFFFFFAWADCTRSPLAGCEPDPAKGAARNSGSGEKAMAIVDAKAAMSVFRMIMKTSRLSASRNGANVLWATAQIPRLHQAREEQRAYAWPALLKPRAAFPAASKVAAASLAVMASVVSTSDKLPPAAAANTAEAADFSSGNSPMTNQS
jgi:hypothetical protein